MFALLLLVAVSSALQACATAEESQDVRPFLLVGGRSEILQMNLNGSNVTTLLTEPGQILAFDYHYRLNLLFWMTERSPSIKYAPFSNLSNVTESEIRTLEPVGLTVDWINDKVYWADKGTGTISVYDISTGEIAEAISLPGSTPTELKVFPQTNNQGFFYMGNFTGGIYKISLNGTVEKEVVSIDCPTSLHFDYQNKDLYYFSSCKQKIGTSRMDGSLSHPLPGTYTFLYGSSSFGNHLYWTHLADSTAIVTCKNVADTGGQQEPEDLHLMKNTVFRDLQVVHPSNQPSMIELDTCHQGWTGDFCSTDVNECAEGNGGCQHKCVNSHGSFHCECEDGMTLTADRKTCEKLDKAPTTSQPPPTTHETTTAATTTPATTTATATTTLPLPKTSTPPLPPQTTTPPTNDVHTTQTESHTPPPTTTTTTTTTPTVGSPSQSVTVTTRGPSSSHPGTTSTKEALTTSSGSAATTEDPALVNTEDGLKVNTKEVNTTPIILAVIISTVVLIIIVVAIMYISFLIYKFNLKKKGSYNVTKLQRKPRPDSNVELGNVSSICSSFRDITELYNNREQLLMHGGSANLGSVEAERGSLVRTASAPSSSSDRCRMMSVEVHTIGTPTPTHSATTTPTHLATIGGDRRWSEYSGCGLLATSQAHGNTR